MKIIIEVRDGIVFGVYTDSKDSLPDVFVVNLDAAEMGEETRAVQADVEPIHRCDNATAQALDDHEARRQSNPNTAAKQPFPNGRFE